MKIVVENARRTRSGEIIATVNVGENGTILYSDVVWLASGRDRARFIDALRDKIPDTAQVEPTLLKLYEKISAQLPSEPSGPSEPSERSEPSLVLPGLVEVVRGTAGLLYWFPDGLKPSVTIDGKAYRPPEKVDLYPLPGEDAMRHVDGDDAQLFDDVADAIYQHIDLPDERGYKVLAAWVLHTYLMEKANYSPIPRFYGPKGSGKSTAVDVLGGLSRRGIATVSLTGPALFRVTEHLGPTLAVDEVRLVGKDANKGIVDLLNARFGRGRMVVRVNTDKQGLECIESYEVFGATVLAGTEDLPDTCASRSIPFIMERNSRPVRRSLDEKRIADLRDRLCAFRCRHMDTVLPDAPRFVRDGRLDDVLLPLYQVILLARPDAEADFMAFGRDLEKKRADEEGLSIDAEVVRAMAACANEVVGGKLRVSAVTAVLNQTRSEKEQLRDETVGRLMSRLGFGATRMAGGYAARFWDAARLERLKRRYGIEGDGSEGSEGSDGSEGSEGCSHTFRVGDLVWCTSGGVIYNARPWRIIDIAEGPDGEEYAMFEETPTGWPVRDLELVKAAGEGAHG